MTLHIVSQETPDGTQAVPLMPGDIELARTSLRSIQGGLEQEPRTPKRRKLNTAARLYRLRIRLFEEMAAGNKSPLIDELIRIAEGDVDPDPLAA